VKTDLSNPESNVAVCTLWTQAGQIDIPKERFAIKGNLYSGNGIKHMLRTLLANPVIRYMIVCGNDRTGSGDDLVSLFDNGVDDEGTIAGTKIRLDGKLTRDIVEIVRKNVKLLDMRGKEAGIEELIDSLEKLPPYGEPVIVEEENDKSSSMSVKDVSGFRLEAETISDAWLKVVDIVMKFGEGKKSEHDVLQKEVLNIMTVINDTGDIEDWLPFDSHDIGKYYETFFGTGDDKGLSYTYGKRLFKYIMSGSEEKWEKEAHATFDQIENAVNHLRKAPHTRRAAAFTWSIKDDSMSENPPCLTQITWNIKYGKLFQTAVFRSHDMFSGWPMNAFALRELQNMMSKDLKVEMGHLTIISNSAHIYENNFTQATEIIKKYFTCKREPFMEDRLGYFTIKIKDREIIVNHLLTDHVKTSFSFSGSKAEEIYKMIMHEGLVSRPEHAAYLGKELGRAEEALKSGKEYIQE